MPWLFAQARTSLGSAEALDCAVERRGAGGLVRTRRAFSRYGARTSSSAAAFFSGRPSGRGRGFDLRMSAAVNGREYSSRNWSDLYWSFGEMLAYASTARAQRAGCFS